MPRNPEAERIIRQFETLNKDRGVLLSTLQDIADYIVPRHNMILSKRSKGSKSPVVIYDSTAEHAAMLLANSLQGAFSMSWFSLKFENEDLGEDHDAKLWLSDTTRRMYEAINRSNLATEAQEVFIDFVTLSTACLLIEEKELEDAGFNGLRFKTYAIDEYVIDENAEGFVDTVIRVENYTARQAYQMFGGNAGDVVLKCYKKEPERIVKYLHATFPRKESLLVIPEKFKYAAISVVVDDAQIVKKSGYEEFPYAVPRWSKASGEMYGRGPGWTALPFSKGLNKTREKHLKALSRDVDPPLLVPETLGKLNAKPGAQNPMRPDLIDKIKPFPSNARHDIIQYDTEMERMAVKDIFFTEQLQLQKKAQMTATESSITFELMERLLGPAYGRLSFELFERIVIRAYGLLSRGRALKEMPESVIGKGGIDIEYVGPLARAQKQAEIQGINNWTTSVVSLQGAFPDIVDNVDSDALARKLAKLTGVSAEIIVPANKVKAKRDARADSEYAAQEKQDLIEGAKAFPQVAKGMQLVNQGGGM